RLPRLSDFWVQPPQWQAVTRSWGWFSWRGRCCTELLCRWRWVGAWYAIRIHCVIAGFTRCATSWDFAFGARAFSAGTLFGEACATVFNSEERCCGLVAIPASRTHRRLL